MQCCSTHSLKRREWRRERATTEPVWAVSSWFGFSATETFVGKVNSTMKLLSQKHYSASNHFHDKYGGQ
jgi:hypothetical protein